MAPTCPRNLPRSARSGRQSRTTASGAPQGPHYQPLDKGQMMERRLAARLPLVLFTIRLEPGPNGEKPGDIKILLHSTDWVNHLLFSPTDPELLMYCHEGPWQKVDRIWMIHTDGTHNTLIHKRTMANEIAGHEFWGLDGETIWYDWQYPKGEDFYSSPATISAPASAPLTTWSATTGRSTSISPSDLDVFCRRRRRSRPGGARARRRVDRALPSTVDSRHANTLNAPDFWQPGVFHSEHLVNMSRHNYREEPNVRFSPDKKLVIFTSNMFGPSYVFGVEVAKAVDPPAADVVSTTELASRYNPVNPPQR